MSARKKSPRPSQPSLTPLTQRRRWLFRGLLVLLPLAALALVELALRLGGYGYDPKSLKRLSIRGEEYFVQNEDFSRRFFPKDLARHPGPIRFPVRKAPGTFRIFVFGESAAMGDPAESFSPHRYLEVLLRGRYPGLRFEIINAAFTAIDSHVIVPIARECAMREGDLWIVYMGNNEMVGPFGAATVFGWQAPPLPIVRAAVALQKLRLGQWLMEQRRKFRTREGQSAWGGMGMFVNHPLAPGDPRKATVYRNFEQNLDEIVRLGLSSGAKVLLNTVAVNLKDCPPFASVTNTNSAELHFESGKALLAETNLARARDEFQLACDNDALPFRADSRINEVIRNEPRKVPDQKLILCDAEAALAAGDASGICGQEVFFEHVHFDFDGRYRLGRIWAEHIAPLLPPSTNSWLPQPECEQQLGLSAWNKAQVIHFIDERLQLPPLSGQANNIKRREMLQARIQQLRAGMTPELAASTRQSFMKMVKQRPQDYFLCQEYAVFLELTADFGSAAKEWQRYCELLPHDSLGYYEAGRMLNAQQRFTEAEELLRTAVALRPSRTDAWVELGNALMFLSKYPDALSSYSTASEQEPRNVEILVRRGKVLAQLNRHLDAIQSYRAAVRLDPGNGLAHHELGVELVLTGDAPAAGIEFGEAARLNPDTLPARFDYAGWLMSQNRWSAAEAEFEAVLRLDPQNAPARENLELLRQKLATPSPSRN